MSQHHRRALVFVLYISTVYMGMAWAQSPPSAEAYLKPYGVSLTTQSLREALHNPTPNVRTLAAGILAGRNDREAIPLIKEAIANESLPGQRIKLDYSLALLNDHQGVQDLIDTCTNSSLDPAFRIEAANQLLLTGSDACLGTTLDIMKDSPGPVSEAIGLEYISHLRTVPVLLLPKLRALIEQGLLDPAPINRQRSGEAIAAFGDKESVSKLQLAATSETTPETRQSLTLSLNRAQARAN